MLWHAAQKHKQLHVDSSTPVHFRVADAADLRASSSAPELLTFSHPNSHPAVTSTAASDSQRSRVHSVAPPKEMPAGSDSSDGSSSSSDVSSGAASARGSCGSRASPSSDSPKAEGSGRGGYDTVIDTFGLCSHSNPVEALQVGLLNLHLWCSHTSKGQYIFERAVYVLNGNMPLVIGALRRRVSDS